MLMKKVQETVAYIESQTALKPEIALVLGTGLGEFAEQLEEACIIPYENIPNFVASTAPGHKGRMIIGKVAGKVVLCMQGRFHYYEGYSMQEITYPVRVMKGLGIKTLFLTNSCGGLNPTFVPGDLMIITDHINFMGDNPLIGANEEAFGVRFPDMTYAYKKELVEVAETSAKTLGIDIKKGTYISYSGPSFETPAEIKLFQLFGGSAVGMSTVPEVIVANHSGMNVLAVSCVTNLAAGILDQPLTADEVFEVANRAGTKFRGLIGEIIKQL